MDGHGTRLVPSGCLRTPSIQYLQQSYECSAGPVEGYMIHIMGRKS